MVNLKLRLYPDSFLLKPSQQIKTIKPTHIKIAYQMHEVMKKHNGIGLSSPQVGVPFSIIVINTLEYDNGVKRTLFNAKVIESSEETIDFNEGCLSFPGESYNKQRSAKVKVEYNNSKMEKVVEEFVGITAICIQHEIDHTNGILFRLDKGDKNV